MSRATVTTRIAAPVELVFETIADARNLQRALPHIIGVEFLTDHPTGLGTRFRETRRIQGKRSTTELEITEYEPNRRLRLATDSHGTIWDSLFEVSPVAEGTELSLTLEAHAHQLLARLASPVVVPAVRDAVAEDLELIKEYCEAGAGEGGGW